MRPTVRSTSLRRFFKKLVTKVSNKNKKDRRRPHEIQQDEPEPGAAPTVSAIGFSPRAAEFCPPLPPRPPTKTVSQVQRPLCESAPSSIAEYEDNPEDEPQRKKARMGSADAASLDPAASLSLDTQDTQGQKRKRGQLPTNPRIATNLSCGFVAHHVADLPSSCRHARPSGLTFYERFPGQVRLATVFEQEEGEHTDFQEEVASSGSSTPSLELRWMSDLEESDHKSSLWADQEETGSSLSFGDDLDDEEEEEDLSDLQKAAGNSGSSTPSLELRWISDLEESEHEADIWADQEIIESSSSFSDDEDEEEDEGDEDEGEELSDLQESAVSSGSSTPSLDFLSASEHEDLQEVVHPWTDQEDDESDSSLDYYEDKDEIARCDAEVARITAGLINADGSKTAAFYAILRPNNYNEDDEDDFTSSPYRLRREVTNNKPAENKPAINDLDMSGLMFLPATEAPKMANNIWAPYEKGMDLAQADWSWSSAGITPMAIGNRGAFGAFAGL